MKTVKLTTDVNINDLNEIITAFEEMNKAEVVKVREIMHFNAIRKNFEIHTYITYRPLSELELN